MRDKYVCNDVSILKKVGQYLITLVMKKTKEAKLTCKYRVLQTQDFAVRLTNEKVYVSFKNKTILTKKCIDEDYVAKLNVNGQNII